MFSPFYIKNIIKKNKEIVIIVLVFLFLALSLILRLNQYHTFTPDWDESNHLRMGYLFYRAILEHNRDWLRDLLTISGQPYPPAYHIIVGFIYMVIGVSPLAGVYVNIPFILILMLSVFKIGEYFENKFAGLLASILIPVLPVFLTLQERTTIDYASISIFLLSFYFILKTEGFTNRKYSILFGLSMVLNLIIKWPFVVPGIPYIFYAINNFISRKKYRKVILLNIMLVIIISLPGFLWYSYNYKSIFDTLSFFWNHTGYPQLIWLNPTGLNLGNILFYLYYVPRAWEGVGMMVLLFFYISPFLLRNNWNSDIKYLLMSVVVTYIVLTYMNDKSPFYLAYTYPLMMIATILMLFKIKKRFFTVLGVILLTLGVLLNFVYMRLDYSNTQKLIARRSTWGYNIDTWPVYFTKFTNNRWPTEEIVKNYLVSNNCSGGILIFPDVRYFNYPSINYYLSINNSENNVVSATKYYNPAKDVNFDINFLKTFDCILVKSGNPGIFSNKTVNRKIEDYLVSHPSFSLTHIKVPDDSLIAIFIKKHE